jgi:hypothetical protein
MSNLLADGAAFLATTQKTKLSQSVVYRRADDSVTVLATIGSTTEQAIDQNNNIIESASRDFIITKADLILSSVEITPERGDRIDETAADGTVYTYEVTAADSRPPWAWHDRYHTRRRISTKLIAKA